MWSAWHRSDKQTRGRVIPVKGLKNLPTRLNIRFLRKGWYSFVIIFFLMFVILPTIFVVSYVFTDWNVIQTDILSGESSVEFQWENTPTNDSAAIDYYLVFASPTPDFNPLDSTPVLNITGHEEHSSVITGINGTVYVYIASYNGTAYSISNIARPDNSLSPSSVLRMEGSNLHWNISGEADSVAIYAFGNGSSLPEDGRFLAWANNSNSWSIPPTYENSTFRLAIAAREAVTYSNAVSVQGGNPPAIALTFVEESSTLSMITNSLGISFEIATIVTVVDIIAGLPMAWIIVRRDFRGKAFLNTLIDMPLAVPTAALGFSTALFWSITSGLASPPGALSVVSSPVLLIILLHVVFSYPYMVRSLGAILEEIDINYEIAGETLGASKLTAVRTITLPLFRAGLVTGVILSFARSLSETGGTMIALATMGSMMKTSPVLIGTWKHASKYNSNLVSALSFTSIVLILLALVLLIVIKLVVMRVKIPFRRVWPTAEKWFSRGFAPKLKDSSAFAFLAIIILIPSFFIFGFVATSQPAAGPSWGPFWNSLYYSFLVAGLVMAVDLILGIPLAIYITRSKSEKLRDTMDVMVNVPLIVPTAALGFSLGVFWSSQAVIPVSGLLLVIFAHVAFTYPLVVRNVVGAMEEISVEYENTARTLGAGPLQVFSKVTFPMVKPAILAGAIMAFTRSLGETGATLAVVPEAITAPVYIVSLIKDYHAYYQAGLACIILIAVSYAAMLSMRFVTRRK